MSRYILKKVLGLIPVMLAATVFIFLMVKASGINPVLATQSGGRMSEEAYQSRLEKYDLDKSVPMQYVFWLKNISAGDFGESVKYKTTVSSLILKYAPVTVGLAVLSFLISQPLAILLGVWSAVKRGTLIDKLILTVTLLMFAVPVFLMSILVILVVSKNFPGYSYTGSYANFSEYLQRLALPAAVMAAHQVALITKITRSSMIEQLSSDYVPALRAKGLGEGTIIFRHALKNAIIPVITVSGIQFGAMIVGCVLVENIFSFPGLGKLIVQGVTVGDISVVQGVSLIVIAVFLAADLITNILYAVIDPRIKEQEGAYA